MFGAASAAGSAPPGPERRATSLAAASRRERREVYGHADRVVAGGAWFQGQGALSPDWLSFSGPYTSPNLGQTFIYQFTRPAPQ